MSALGKIVLNINVLSTSLEVDQPLVEIDMIHPRLENTT